MSKARDAKGRFAKAPQFKVGDRVERTTHSPGNTPAGTHGTVTTVLTPNAVLVDWDGYGKGVHTHIRQCRKVEEAHKPEPESCPFKVGDRVERTDYNTRDTQSEPGWVGTVEECYPHRLAVLWDKSGMLLHLTPDTLAYIRHLEVEDAPTQMEEANARTILTQCREELHLKPHESILKAVKSIRLDKDAAQCGWGASQGREESMQAKLDDIKTIIRTRSMACESLSPDEMDTLEGVLWTLLERRAR